MPARARAACGADTAMLDNNAANTRQWQNFQIVGHLTPIVECDTRIVILDLPTTPHTLPRRVRSQSEN